MHTVVWKWFKILKITIVAWLEGESIKQLLNSLSRELLDCLFHMQTWNNYLILIFDHTPKVAQLLLRDSYSQGKTIYLTSFFPLCVSQSTLIDSLTNMAESSLYADCPWLKMVTQLLLFSEKQCYFRFICSISYGPKCR